MDTQEYDSSDFDCAYNLLFLKCAQPPSPIKTNVATSRELKRINDWNGAARVSGGISGQQVSADGRSCACGAGRDHRRGCGLRR